MLGNFRSRNVQTFFAGFPRIEPNLKRRRDPRKMDPDPFIRIHENVADDGSLLGMVVLIGDLRIDGLNLLLQHDVVEPSEICSNAMKRNN